jgi:hypothetical protein
MQTTEFNYQPVNNRHCVLHVTDSIEDYLNVTRENSIGDYADSWSGESYEDCATLCRNGDLSLVEASDQFMAQMEGLIGFERRSFRTINDVVGAAPNIGNYLAGNPMSMRRRARTMTEQAPLTILVDLTCSAGNTAKELQARGAVCLSLLRILSTSRPVRIYAGTSLDIRHRDMCGIMTPLDSSPLDLGRAGHVLSSLAFNRRLAYNYLRNDGYSGGWPFGDVNKWRPVAADVWGRVFGTDILYVPPITNKDKILVAPAEWLKDMVAKYGQNAELD